MLIVIFHGSPSVIKLIRLLPAFMHDIMMPCEITDQLAVGTQNYFSTLFYTLYRGLLTLKQAPRMHQNAPLPDKKIKKNSGEATCTAPSPLGGEYPSPYLTHSPPLGAFGARRPVPFHLRLEHWP